MLKRSACINLTHHSALAGMEYGITQQLDLPAPEKYHDDLIYPALIQAGVHTFKVSKIEAAAKKFENGMGLEGRLKFDESMNLYSTSESFNNALCNVLLVEKDEKTKSLIFGLAFFLAELSNALRSKAAMVTVIPKPEIKDYYGLLPLEVIAPIELLMKSIGCVETETPVPQSFLPYSAATNCLEILDSYSFQRYAESFHAIENEKTVNKSNLARIAQSAKGLQKSFNNTLDVKRATISLLPVTAQLIDAFSGKVPGIIINALCGSLEDYLREQKRMIIYDYRVTHLEMLKKHYLAIKARGG